MTLHVYILRSHYWQVQKKKETDFVQAKMATVELQLSVDPFAKLPIMKASFELLSFSSIHMNVRIIIRHSGNQALALSTVIRHS